MDVNIAIIHYHLNRGGVTQVIANHLRSLNSVARGHNAMRVALLHGGKTEGWPENLKDELGNLRVESLALPELDYDDGHPRVEQLSTRILEALASLGFAADSTVLHVHNHALGKNVSLPGAISILCLKGYRFLLQIHDFAEDSRPANYRRLTECQDDTTPIGEVLYPQASSIHFSVLNRRDQQILLAAGVDKQRLHFLPNPVAPFGEFPRRDEARRKLEARFGIPTRQRLLLYPIRGIRRKNLGEALLWSALGGGDLSIGITLAPLNPIEKPFYDAWCQLARRVDLPVRFELGAEGGLTFLENLAASDQILTTSIAEGFGMVYLESWLAQRSLIGRDLPEITADFKDAGLDLTSLYDELVIPMDWIDRDQLRGALKAACTRAVRGYDLPSSKWQEIDQSIESNLELDQVDFARLDSNLQRQVIESVLQSAERRQRLIDGNPKIGRALIDPLSTARRNEPNAEVVRSSYSLDSSGRRLLEIYDQVVQSQASQQIDPPSRPERILDAFLDVSRIQPIRLEE